MRARNTNKQKRKTKQKKSENKRKRKPERTDATRNLELKKIRAEKNEAAPWHRLPSPRTRKTGGDSNHGVGCSVRQRLRWRRPLWARAWRRLGRPVTLV
nr:MAG TPA: hypothetical protein [Caudoviricetes sp.]